MTVEAEGSGSGNYHFLTMKGQAACGSTGDAIGLEKPAEFNRIVLDFLIKRLYAQKTLRVTKEKRKVT